jgi:hypothetical protein
MFIVHLPANVHIGDTVDVRINKEPARVTWRDAGTLVIEPGDARRIVRMLEEPDMNTFICADVDGTDNFTVITESPRSLEQAIKRA